MEDFAEKISQILSDEQSLKQMQELATMLGLSTENEQNLSEDIDISKLGELLGQLKASSQEDNNIAFLTALKPLLKEKNQEKVQKAIKLLKLLNLLPIIRQSGLFDDETGGDIFGLL